FDQPRPSVETITGGAVNTPYTGKATTMAGFSTPGEYVLHVTANDYSGVGGSGFVCCWTTGLVKVSVGPGPGGIFSSPRSFCVSSFNLPLSLRSRQLWRTHSAARWRRS